MTAPLAARQIDLLSAAERHIRDAEHLLQHGQHQSHDQAWHLAGFGPECVRKACIEDRMLDRVLGHNLGDRAEQLLEWGLAIDPHASRYHLSEWAVATPVLVQWTPEHRYERTGTTARAKRPVADLVAAARKLVSRVHADLWADGRITGREG